MTELPPPVLTENGSYENWRNEIQMWQITTTMEPKRQALAVRAKLTGKVREEALKLDAADLNNDSGMSFLIDALDAQFRKPKKWDPPPQSIKEKSPNSGQKTKKWDIPNNVANENNNGNSPIVSAADSNLSAAEKARQRAAVLSNKLAAEGKYQTQPLSLLPKALPDQFTKPLATAVPSLLNVQATAPHQIPPDVKKLENGNSFAEFNINDVCARPFLTRTSTRELIAQQSGAAITLRGRFLTQEDKRQQVITGVVEKPLVLNIQANVAAKVQVAIYKIMEVCRNYEKFGADNNFNNYGLTNNTVNSSHHFVQDKLFVGLENIHLDFNLREKLAGENGTNFSFMVQQTGAKVFLRGRGSGYLEPNSGRESFEALHIYISHPRQDGLDMARQLCESLIETVKTQYQHWNAQRMNLPPNPSFQPPYLMNQELRYPIYQQNNGFNAGTYGSGPMGKDVRPLNVQESSQIPRSSAPSSYPSNVPAVVDYRAQFSSPAPSVSDTRSVFSESTGPMNHFRTPESNFDGSNAFLEKERFPNPNDRYTDTNEKDRFRDPDREKKGDRSRRRHRSKSRSKSPVNEVTPNKCRSRSPDSKRSRSRDSKSSSKTKDSPQRPSNRRESSPSRRDAPQGHREISPPRRDVSPSRRGSPIRRGSPSRRDSPHRRWDLSPPRRDSPISLLDPSIMRELSSRRDVSPHNRRSSSSRKQSSPPARRDSPTRQKESSPERKEERKRRKFTEEPKKRRKFSEDPRLLEQTKTKTEAVLVQPPEEEIELSTLEYLQAKSTPSNKLQFRSKKAPSSPPRDEESSRKPKSILKMAPPPIVPVKPTKVNGTPKSVKISPAGLAAKKRATFKEDKFVPPPPIEKLKPPSPPQAPQKVLKMGALSSLAMYEDSDEDD